MRDEIGTMQERVRNDLPDVKIRLTVDGLQRPQREDVLQGAIRQGLQEEHRDVRGYQ